MEQKKIKLSEFFDRRMIMSILITIIGTTIYSASVVWLLNTGEFYAGGITGISQLISRTFFPEFMGSLPLFIGLINFPLFLFGMRGVSKKFAILTIISVGLQMIMVAIFQEIANIDEFNPFIEIVKTTEIINGKEVVSFDNGGRLLISILGGSLSGFGIALCLKAGGSSGGMDVIANYLLVKKNISFTKYSFIVDLVIISCSAYFGTATALFTIIRLICSMFVVANVYTSYKMVKIEVITNTEKLEELRREILKNFHHGMTMYAAIGGYSLEPRKKLEIVLSMYEVDDYIAFIEKIDSRAFIEISELRNIRGNYKKRTIA